MEDFDAFGEFSVHLVVFYRGPEGSIRGQAANDPEQFNQVRDEDGIPVCAICRERIVLAGDALRLTDVAAQTECGHPYHPKCLQDWLNRGVRCPLCENLLRR